MERDQRRPRKAGEALTRDDYLRQVSFALRDLPWRQRRDLVSELRAHLSELPAETNLRQRLGPPEQYAAEMRSAAGLERRRGVIAFLRARRPRNLVIAVLVTTVIGLAIGTLVWIDSYQPLRAGNAYYTPGAQDSPTGDGIYYVFRQGKPFHYGMTIWNSGRFTVRVLGVPIQFGMPIKYRLLMSAPTTFDYGGIPRPYTPFHPFDLKPGEERGIVLSGAYNEPCRLRGLGSEPRNEIPVRFSFLWQTKTIWVSPPQPLAFVFTKASECAKARR
jgi:hypothetical protein